ncbi:MAG: N-acetylglucosamine kinase [Chitinophagaceae bacterium]
MSSILIADSGATKCEWVLLANGKKKKIVTQGISPYFLSGEQIADLLARDLLPKLKNAAIDAVYYYGTGLLNHSNIKLLEKVLKKTFPHTKTIKATDDVYAVAHATCGDQKGIACILGTGSNACFYNGKKITERRTGIGYVLGDEGSGAYLGKKVLQYYLYNTFDEELMAKFIARFQVANSFEIIEHVYRQPLANRYIASFAIFLAENRGHYMVENIIEDGLNDFIFTHLCKFPQVWSHPIHFSGSIAYGFRDVLHDLCNAYELTIGSIVKEPMPGLIKYYSEV